MINSPFFQQFLKASNFYTLAAIVALAGSIVILKKLKDRKVSFSNRMLIGLVFGLILGFGIDLIGGSSDVYLNFGRIEISVWYSLVGRGFVKLVQLMAVPVVFLSIINVVIDVEGKRIKSLTAKTFTTLLSTTAISALVGILVVKLFNLQGSNFTGDLSASSIDRMSGIASQSFPEFFLNLIPNNIISVMGDNGSVVSVVVIAAMIAGAIRFLKVKKPDQIKPLISLLDSLTLTINSTLINIIKLMPYGVIALVANTIISNGIAAITSVIGFIVAIYVAIIIMMLVYVVILLALGLNPLTFYKKAYTTIVFAFSSRSSVGTLPYTLKTLTEDLGVSKETANFVATLGTSIGMNGCAGVFPAMLATLVAAVVGVEMTISFYFLVVIVVTVGSIGIAGVPGTATVAATVTLNGLGLGAAMSYIGSIFGIDPIIDMGRTALNVTGSMISAIVVDNWEDSFDKDLYNANLIKSID
ncbi:MAG TPA: cation:dicarboxylase symporter family transporter [Erysipelotrichaceae bacterium]|nr:cation:dicarboxylase symporter family transporter [Erysipelotrichaceae bacterium]